MKEKIETKIREDLFAKLNIKIDRCTATVSEKEVDTISVFGDLTCTETWDEKNELLIKANLCNAENEIIEIGLSHRLYPYLTGYESFELGVFGRTLSENVRVVEIYPEVVKAYNRR